MQIDLTWFDAALILLLAGCVVIGLRRGAAGFVIGIGGVIAWAALNVLGLLEPLLGLIVALGAGAGLTALARAALSWPPVANLSDNVSAALGGVGGAVLGASLAAALALSFPTSPNPAAGRGHFYYPSAYLPGAVKVAVEDSAIQRWLTSTGVWARPGVARALLLPDRGR